MRTMQVVRDLASTGRERADAVVLIMSLEIFVNCIAAPGGGESQQAYSIMFTMHTALGNRCEGICVGPFLFFAVQRIFMWLSKDFHKSTLV